MRTYLKSLFSIRKFTYPNVSFLSVWDSKSSFDVNSEIRYLVKLKASFVGKYSRLNPGCQLSHASVGNFTAIGRGTSAGLGRHPLNYLSTQNIFYKRNNLSNQWVQPIDLPTLPITIGSDVWIGVECLVLDGVTIGHGAVVGARSVVTKDVPPYAVVAGVPARVVKYRFDDLMISRLLEISWWNWSEDEISKHIDLFRRPDLSLQDLDTVTK